MKRKRLHNIFSKTVFLLIIVDSLESATVTRFFDKEATILPSKSIANTRFDYGIWPEPQNILFRLSRWDGFNSNEVRKIRQAMSRISQDMSGCIQFVPYRSLRHAGKPHLHISKTYNNRKRGETCFSFPGRVLRPEANQGQKLLIRDGPDGCLETVREPMKFLALALGVRNEYNRPDRDNYIQVFPANIRYGLRGLFLLQKYDVSRIELLTPFDFHSITMHQPAKYTNPGTVYFKPVPSSELDNYEINLNNSHLSVADCIGIATIYEELGCRPSRCEQQLGTTSRTTAASSTVPSTVGTAAPETLPTVSLPQSIPTATINSEATTAATQPVDPETTVATTTSQPNDASTTFRPVDPGETVATVAPEQTLEPLDPGETVPTLATEQTIAPLDPGETLPTVATERTIGPLDPGETVAPVLPDTTIRPLEPGETVAVVNPTQTTPPLEPRETIGQFILTQQLGRLNQNQVKSLGHLTRTSSRLMDNLDPEQLILW